MGRPKQIDRPSPIHISIPRSLADKLELELMSEVEGRVPYGAKAQLIMGLLEQMFAVRAIRLQAYKQAKGRFEGQPALKYGERLEMLAKILQEIGLQEDALFLQEVSDILYSKYVPREELL